jgi:hypothetical protein
MKKIAVILVVLLALMLATPAGAEKRDPPESPYCENVVWRTLRICHEDGTCTVSNWFAVCEDGAPAEDDSDPPRQDKKRADVPEVLKRVAARIPVKTTLPAWLLDLSR